MQTTIRYWQLRLRQKRCDSPEGFTLVELLVVIVILGVLAAVAVPSLLDQLGKARETSMKNAVGSINRAQQAYHFAEGVFANNESELDLVDIASTSPYIDSLAFASVAPAEAMGVNVINVDASSDGTRAHVGAVSFDAGVYRTIMCRSRTAGPTIADAEIANVANALDSGATAEASCASGTDSDGTTLDAVN